MRSEAILTAKQPFVLSTIANGVATLTLSHPERFNPLSYQMISGIQAELDAIASDPAVRIVILAAEGKGFCAGHDLKEMRAHAEDKGWQQSLFNSCSRMMITLTEIPQPVIARVHGIATAAADESSFRSTSRMASASRRMARRSMSPRPNPCRYSARASTHC